MMTPGAQKVGPRNPKGTVWSLGHTQVEYGVSLGHLCGQRAPSPLGWVRSLSLWATRQSGRWKRPRVRPLSSLSEDGMDRLLSSSRDKSLSESESAPRGGRSEGGRPSSVLGREGLGEPRGWLQRETGLGTWGLGRAWSGHRDGRAGTCQENQGWLPGGLPGQ